VVTFVLCMLVDYFHSPYVWLWIIFICHMYGCGLFLDEIITIFYEIDAQNFIFQ
jgi:hypothetical protein